MKKLILSCIIGMFVLSGIGTVATTNIRDTALSSISESIAVSELVIKDTGPYVTVTLDEAASSLLDPGKPLLPVVTKVFVFPFGTRILDVTVRASEAREISISKPVIPASEPMPVGSAEAPKTIQDPMVYDQAPVYPFSGFCSTTRAGVQGNDHVVFVIVQWYPVRYAPAQNMLYFSDYAQIQVSYEEPATPSLFSDDYDLVIIAPSRFSNALQPLIDHKVTMGVNALLKTTEEIYAEYNGFDEAEEIKYYIKKALDTLGVSYVLLVGSIKNLPIRTTWFFQRTHDHYWNETVLTDLYYADIYDADGKFSNWDTNDNGLYGEVYINCPGVSDICDFYPDVHVGRLPCDRVTEVRTVVNKIIRYETETAGESWFNNIILVGGDTFPGWDGNEGEIKNLLTAEIMSDFNPVWLWTSDDSFTAKSLNQAINRGAGFIDYSGHGFEIGLGTHPPNSEEWVTYHSNNLFGAVNFNKLPIVFFDACLTAKLDFNLSEFLTYALGDNPVVLERFSRIAALQIPTFAWWMVRLKSGGAIATIGATRTAFGGLDSGAGYISLRFFEAYNTSDTVGEMMTSAQNDYITFIPSDRFTVEEFILIGDPSLKIGGY